MEVISKVERTAVRRSLHRMVRSLVAHGRLIEKERDTRRKRVRCLGGHTDCQRENEERRQSKPREFARGAQAKTSEPNEDDNRERPDNAADESVEALAKSAAAKEAGDVICKPKGDFPRKIANTMDDERQEDAGDGSQC